MAPDNDPIKSPPDGDRLLSPRKLGEEAGLAFGLLTRLPLPAFDVTTSANLTSSFWAFPIAGAVVGLIGAVVMTIAEVAGLGTFSAVVLAMIAMVCVTGALHEDGMADFCDGLGGGKDRAGKLEIMRDSHLGTYGALGLVLSVAVEASLLIEVVAYVGLFAAAGVVVVVATLARLAIAVPLYFLISAREDGLAKMLGKPAFATLAAAAFLAIGIAWLTVGWGGALSLLIGAGLGSCCVTLLAARHIGGYTGDVFGATVVVAKIASMVIYILAVLGP